MHHHPVFGWEFEISNIGAHTPNVSEQHVRCDIWAESSYFGRVDDGNNL